MPKAVRKSYLARKTPDSVYPPEHNREFAVRPHPDDALDPDKAVRRDCRTIVVNTREHAISWLYHRNLITAVQFAAADKLRADYERAGLVRMSTMQWSKTADRVRYRSSASVPDQSLAQMDAKRRFDAAIKAVGPGLADICWRLICANETITDAEKTLGWPARSGRIVLAIALDRLAIHYGMQNYAAGGATTNLS